MASHDISARSITVGNMFKLIQQVRQDMVRGGYCFVTEQEAGNLHSRDNLYLLSELSDQVKENSTANLKRPDSMELASHHLRSYFQRERFHPKERYLHDDEAASLQPACSEAGVDLRVEHIVSSA